MDDRPFVGDRGKKVQEPLRAVFTNRTYNRVNLDLRVAIEPDFNDVTSVPVVTISCKWQAPKRL